MLKYICKANYISKKFTYRKNITFVTLNVFI